MLITKRKWCCGGPFFHYYSRFPLFACMIRVYQHNLSLSHNRKASEPVPNKYTSQSFKELKLLFEPDLREDLHKIRLVLSRYQNGKVEDLVQSLQINQDCCKIQLSEMLITDLLQKYGDDWKSALGVFQWAASRPGYKHGVDAYNKMVDLLGKMKQMDKMWDLVNEMKLKGLVNKNTVSKVMRRLAGAGKWEDVMSTFDGLESLSLKKDTETMNILLDTLCKEYRVEMAREKFLSLKAYIPPDAFTFNIFVYGWCKARKIDEAEWTISEMKSCGFLPSVITYSTIIHAYCNQSNFQKACELLSKMNNDGFPANIVTYTGILHKLNSSREIEVVSGLTKQIKSAGVKPDVIYFNCLIKILGKAGRLAEASLIYDVEMPESGVAPTLSTYNTMISVSCHHFLKDNALRILKEMELASCRPDLLTYTPLLKLYFRLGESEDEINNLLNDMINKHHLSLDSGTYALLIHGFCRNGKFERALLLFEEMIQWEIPLRKQTYNLLKEIAEEKGLYKAIEKIDTLVKMNDNSGFR